MFYESKPCNILGGKPVSLHFNVNPLGVSPTSKFDRLVQTLGNPSIKYCSNSCYFRTFQTVVGFISDEKMGTDKNTNSDIVLRSWVEFEHYGKPTIET